MDMLESVVLKVITAGEGGVGKTTLLNRYVKGIFMTDTKMTIGVNFLLKEIMLDNTRVSLQMWDFTGQEHLRHLLEQYSHGAHGALFMFDLSNINRSLRNLDEWWDIMTKYADLPVMLVGTKCDLLEENPNSQRKFNIFKHVIEETREKYPFIDYMLTSSKNGYNIAIVVEQLVKYILQKGDY